MNASMKDGFKSLPLLYKVLLLTPCVIFFTTLFPWGRALTERVYLNLGTLEPLHLLRLLAAPLVYPKDALFPLILEAFVFFQLLLLFVRRWRPSHFLFFFYFCTLVGGLLELLFFTLLPARFEATVYGLGAPLFGLLAAFYMVFGDQRFMVPGIASPKTGKTLVKFVLGVELLFFVIGGNPRIAYHAGGFLAGWLLVTGRWRPRRLLNWASVTFKDLRWKWKRRRFRTV